MPTRRPPQQRPDRNRDQARAEQGAQASQCRRQRVSPCARDREPCDQLSRFAGETIRIDRNVKRLGTAKLSGLRSGVQGLRRDGAGRRRRSAPCVRDKSDRARRLEACVRVAKACAQGRSARVRTETKGRRRPDGDRWAVNGLSRSGSSGGCRGLGRPRGGTRGPGRGGAIVRSRRFRTWL